MDYQQKLEDDLRSIFADRLRESEDFCVELWSSLSNVDWIHESDPNGEMYRLTARGAGAFIAETLGKGSYTDWYWSGPNSVVSRLIEESMIGAGWRYVLDLSLDFDENGVFAQEYTEGLKKAHYQRGFHKLWEDFEENNRGASKEVLAKLKEIYPDVPDTLLHLLEYTDGTYHIKKKYNTNISPTLCLPFFGSDWEGYEYYLLSVEDMIVSWRKDPTPDFLGHALEHHWVDKRITRDAETAKWLCFANGNNGDSSGLFIDFTPSSTGKKGQIVSYMHDPDEYIVIAYSFDEFLKLLMGRGYDFIQDYRTDEKH